MKNGEHPTTTAVFSYGFRPFFDELLAAVRTCRACTQHLPCGSRLALRAGETARILIVGQAPAARSGSRRNPVAVNITVADARGRF